MDVLPCISEAGDSPAASEGLRGLAPRSTTTVFFSSARICGPRAVGDEACGIHVAAATQRRHRSSTPTSSRTRLQRVRRAVPRPSAEMRTLPTRKTRSAAPDASVTTPQLDPESSELRAAQNTGLDGRRSQGAHKHPPRAPVPFFGPAHDGRVPARRSERAILTRCRSMPGRRAPHWLPPVPSRTAGSRDDGRGTALGGLCAAASSPTAEHDAHALPGVERPATSPPPLLPPRENSTYSG